MSAWTSSLNKGQRSELFAAEEGLAGAPGQKGWDLLIPVCTTQPQTLAQTQERMTSIAIQAKNQVDGPAIDAGYYLADSFLVNTTEDLPEALFVMKFGGQTKD